MELFFCDPDCHEVVDHVEDEDEREVDGRGRDGDDHAVVLAEPVDNGHHGQAVDDDGDEGDGGDEDEHEDGRPRDEDTWQLQLPEGRDGFPLLRDRVPHPTHESD